MMKWEEILQELEFLDKKPKGLKLLFRRSRWLTFLFIFVCMPCGFCGIVTANYFFQIDILCWSAANFPYRLESLGEFRLPSSVRILDTVADNGSNWCVVATKFELPSADLQLFAKSTRIKALTPNAQVIWQENHEKYIRKLGYDLASVNSYLFGYKNTNYFNQQYIFVDTSDPDKYIVYLVIEQGFLD